MNTTPAHFPLNAWYAAAYDVEVGRSLLARTICKQKLVLYRQTTGAVAALEDACWHRLLPLSMGRLDGDQVVCGYHGLGVQRRGPLHAHAQPGNAQPFGLRAPLSGGREAPLHLGLAGRPGAGRRIADPRPALERRSGLGRRRQDDPREVRFTGW